MTSRTVRLRSRGFLALDSHPVGCARIVDSMAAEVTSGAAESAKPPVALIIGASGGYGLAMTLAGIKGYGMSGVAVALEQPATRRSATAGWYRTVRTAQLAAEHGVDFRFVNTDCFSDRAKDDILDLLEADFGQVDYLIYSVAAPRRTDPETGLVHHSVIKTLGSAQRTKALHFNEDGDLALREVEVEPATDEERMSTVKVMGGEDWALWVNALIARGLIGPKFKTVALSYIGSELTSQIYRQGTIGAAKAHLEQTAVNLTSSALAPHGGVAYTSVNGAAVTQASMAIPSVALYSCILRDVLGTKMESPMQQSISLWDQLTGRAPVSTDTEGRIRLDSWELDPPVQKEIADRWSAISPDDLSKLADLDWFRASARQLYGFEVPGVDYEAEVEVDLPWPSR